MAKVLRSDINENRSADRRTDAGVCGDVMLAQDGEVPLGTSPPCGRSINERQPARPAKGHLKKKQKKKKGRLWEATRKERLWRRTSCQNTFRLLPRLQLGANHCPLRHPCQSHFLTLTVRRVRLTAGANLRSRCQNQLWQHNKGPSRVRCSRTTLKHHPPTAQPYQNPLKDHSLKQMRTVL
ncbi:hypothetical protein SKAU_G00123710 [Synaphobranchus kaupii]|uniref:Uncharacterized protein n=1 Tax=Synaphobranchus kaupii TaxID=118154 RepID=A0A9Q1FPP7_SYNKA|nr:hypothetical protein SKAU_G00123710 [Synaphobranchus kaupii]